MHRRRLLAAAAKLREELVPGVSPAAAKVWIGRLDDDQVAYHKPSASHSSSRSERSERSDESNLAASSSSSYVLPGAIASLSRWRAVAPVHRTAQLLGVANCPRLRILRDVIVGDGSLANLAGLVTVDGNGRSGPLNPALLALWFTSPGVVISLRSHELWGLGSPAGAFGVGLGFALVAMWCHGLLEVATRWLGGATLEPATTTTTRRRRMRGGVRRRRAGRRSIAGEGLDDDDDEDEDEDEDDEDDGAFRRRPRRRRRRRGLGAGFHIRRVSGPDPVRVPGPRTRAHARGCVLGDARHAVVCRRRPRRRRRSVPSRVEGRVPVLVRLLARPGIAVLERFTPRGAHTRRGGGGTGVEGRDPRGRGRRPRAGGAASAAARGVRRGRPATIGRRLPTGTRAKRTTTRMRTTGRSSFGTLPSTTAPRTTDRVRRRLLPERDRRTATTILVEAMERIIFGPAGDAATSLDVLEGLGRARVSSRDGARGDGARTLNPNPNANTRDAGTGVGSVTTTTTGSGTSTGGTIGLGISWIQPRRS